MIKKYLKGNAFWNVCFEEDGFVAVLHDIPFHGDERRILEYLSDYILTADMHDEIVRITKEIHPFYKHVEHTYWMYEFLYRLQTEVTDVDMNQRIDITMKNGILYLNSGDYEVCVYNNQTIIYNTSVMYQDNYNCAIFLVWHPLIQALKDNYDNIKSLFDIYSSLSYNEIPMILESFKQVDCLNHEEMPIFIS